MHSASMRAGGTSPERCRQAWFEGLLNLTCATINTSCNIDAGGFLLRRILRTGLGYHGGPVSTLSGFLGTLILTIAQILLGLKQPVNWIRHRSTFLQGAQSGGQPNCCWFRF